MHELEFSIVVDVNFGNVEYANDEHHRAIGGALCDMILCEDDSFFCWGG